MRRLFAVLSLFALLVLVAAVAVCGVVGLVEAPMEAGLTLAEVAPEFAECPLGATALDVACLTACKCEVHGVRRSVDEHMPILAAAAYNCPRATGTIGGRGVGVHAKRG